MSESSCRAALWIHPTRASVGAMEGGTNPLRCGLLRMSLDHYPGLSMPDEVPKRPSASRMRGSVFQINRAAPN